MRLLNTSTLKLEEFFGIIPYYAILSHRWEREEVSFQDLNSGEGPNKKGYAKVFNCCKQAISDGWKYVVSDALLRQLFACYFT
jgi:hypothetical protein